MKLAAAAVLLLPLLAFGQDHTTPNGDHVTVSDHSVTFHDGIGFKPDTSGKPGGTGTNAHDVEYGRRDGGASNTPVDYYPELTAANNAYKQAVVRWQSANQQLENALKDLAQFQEKYVDETGHARSGWQEASVQSILGSLQEQVTHAEFEVREATDAKNLASSRANEAFRDAAAKFAESERARAEQARVEAAQAAKMNNRQDKFDHH